VTFTAHDLFRVTGTQPGGSAYDRLEQALRRLKSTTVFTNIETGGEGEDSGFSWVLDYKIRYRRGSGGEKTMRAIEILLCDWIYRAILKDGKMLTYDHRYFELPPLQKRLYEIARAHCGRQAGFKMNLEKLRLRVGTPMEPRHFKQELLRIARGKKGLPGYGLTLLDPRAQNPAGPKPATRPSPKTLLVFFFPTEKRSGMVPPSQAPLIGDDFPDEDPLVEEGV